MRVAVFIVMFCLSGHAYRFICNGILASGEERGDECGVCDERTAARWSNPNIPVVVADSPLPKGFNKNDWLSVVRDSFKAWEVSGSSLRFVQVNGQSKRDFGANESLHEIFWITNKDEWRRLVGSGEYGTLGATLPTYTCGDEDGRVIIDADLALNGVGYIKWKPKCESDDCFSVKTTVLHELGHFFGGDHPCVDCDESIMSARGRPGANLHYPMFDDMALVRVLYPDGSKGGFGYPCEKDKDCALGNLCITDDGNRYCSHRCETDENCQGAICQTIDTNNVCTFMNGKSDQKKRLLENCSDTPCMEPLICAGVSDENYYCFMSCKSDKDCGERQRCTETGDKEFLCMNVKTLNETCDHKELCTKGLVCIFDGYFSGICRAPCTVGCKADEICQTIDKEQVCMPKTQSLMLDDSVDRFDPKRGQNAFGRSQKSSSNLRSGCSVLQDNFLWFWLVVALLFLRKRLFKGLNS